MTDKNKKDKKQLNEYVEDKIFRYTFKAQNFTKEEMAKADKFCKLNFGNDRKKMILTLINYVENNTGLQLLNEKLNRFIVFVTEELDKLNSTTKNIKNNKEKKGWEGLKH